jgi:chemotaxis protein CheC
MSQVRELNEIQRDALREVANIGAGHAATALSRMTDRTIMIEVPEVSDCRLGTVAEAVGSIGSNATAVVMNMMGDLTGRTAVVLSLSDTRILCDLLLRRIAGTTSSLGEMEESSIRETGNILTSAYLTALSDFMGLMLVPSVPTLLSGPLTDVLTSVSADFDEVRGMVICVDTAFRIERAPEVLHGAFLLLPDPVSVETIFDAIHLS